ncbi:hypothetical protein BT93_C2026 [Corymbia citriodora subsp. variegata]|nr:hypothetical protein BT93_C2026 [Corymbia citriodora subsp. variegata]
MKERTLKQKQRNGKTSIFILERWIELGLGFFSTFSSSSFPLLKQIAVAQCCYSLAPHKLQSIIRYVGHHRLFFARFHLRKLEVLRELQVPCPFSSSVPLSWRNLVHSLTSSVAGFMGLNSSS